MADFKKTSDEKLANLIRESDKDLFAEIIRRYQTKLHRYVTYLISDPDQAADVVQETFIKTYTNLNSFNAKKKFSSWIYRIAHNTAMTCVKKNPLHSNIDDQPEFASSTDLEDDLIIKDLIQATNNCLLHTPIIYREVITLYFLEEKSYQEISDILRLPIGTIGTRINRGKQILKNICQKNHINSR